MISSKQSSVTHLPINNRTEWNRYPLSGGPSLCLRQRRLTIPIHAVTPDYRDWCWTHRTQSWVTICPLLVGKSVTFAHLSIAGRPKTKVEPPCEQSVVSLLSIRQLSPRRVGGCTWPAHARCTRAPRRAVLLVARVRRAGVTVGARVEEHPLVDRPSETIWQQSAI